MAEDIIRTCVDRILPKDLLEQAARIAIHENPANMPMLVPGLGSPPLRPLEMALITTKKWNTGRTLRVRFLDGDPVVQAKVEQYASEWSQYANISFEFSSDPEAEIRISFRQSGSWSYLGTECLSIASDDPTMNFGWFTPASKNDEVRGVVLHEFGHALGCIHEHQNPQAGIHWNKEVVYRSYMGGPNHWTKEQVDTNVLAKYSRDQTQFTEWDPTSIMEYFFPKEFTTDGYEVPLNKELSPMDKTFIGRIYPKQIAQLAIDSSPTEAAISQPGEEELYQFRVMERGRYRIEMQGQANVAVILFGPDDQVSWVTPDPDSGKGHKAKIAATLEPATYYVRARHNSREDIGKYAISIQTEK